MTTTPAAEIERSASLSEDGRFRYQLRRRWGGTTRGLVNWIMLNPSTADAEFDDPTIRRVMRFSREWGYSGCVVTNLYALRATDPAQLLKAGLIEATGGDENYDHVISVAIGRDVIAAWGAHRAARERPYLGDLMGAVRRNARSVRCLGLTSTDQPKHPLYLPADTVREDFS